MLVSVNWPINCIYIVITQSPARWLITMVTTFCLQFLSDYETDKSIQHLVDTYDWYIIPVVNPDGYVFSHAHVRHFRS